MLPALILINANDLRKRKRIEEEVMNRELLKILIFAGVCFGIWPQIIRKSDLDPSSKALAVAITTTLVVGSVFVKRGAAANYVLGLPLFLAIGIAVLAGSLNGMGTVKLLDGVSNIPQELVAKAAFTIILAQVISNEVVGAILNGAPFTIRKALGLVSAIITFKLMVL